MLVSKLVMVFDFNNTVFSSWSNHPLYNSKGQNVNAIRGFFQKMRTLKQTFDPDFIVFTSDLTREQTFRRKLYAPYKAQRKALDEDIFHQMKYVSKLVALLGFQTLNDYTYEADDLMGMISRFDESHNMHTIIVSSDRDLYQLVTDHTWVVSNRDGNLVDKSYIKTTYGLTPEQWIELKCLQGDSSDNVPGIRGVGPKTALELMNKYGSIDAIYSHLGELKPGLRNKLEEGRDILPLTRTLVTILTNYELINLTMDKLYRYPPYTDEIYDTLCELEVQSLVNIFKYELLPHYNDKIEVYERGPSKDTETQVSSTGGESK